MTSKEEFELLGKLKDELDSHRVTLNVLKAQVDNQPQSNEKNPLKERIYNRITDTETIIEGLEGAYLQTETKLLNVISMLPDEKCKQAMELRYIYFYTLEGIAKIMGYHKQSIKRFIKKAFSILDNN